MKTDKVPGEFAFRALVLGYCGHPGTSVHSWQLTDGYFFELGEVKLEYPNLPIKWPVEVWEDGTVYIPSEEEL